MMILLSGDGMHKRIALDYDGTLVEDVHPRTDGKATKGAKEFTEKIKREGWEILITTCRPDWERKELESNLRKQGIAFDYIFFYQKPGVSFFVDDKAVRFEGDWNDIYSFIKKKSLEYHDAKGG